MLWVYLLAALIVLAVAASVLPKGSARSEGQFPWFWTVFPVFIFCMAYGIHQGITVWMTPEVSRYFDYAPLGTQENAEANPRTLDSLGKLLLTREDRVTAMLLAFVVSGAALVGSAWSWRHKRY